jgi:hypothetical protein
MIKLPPFNPNLHERNWVKNHRRAAKVARILWENASTRERNNSEFLRLLIQCTWTNTNENKGTDESDRRWRNSRLSAWLGLGPGAKSVPLEVRAEMWRSGKRITLDSKGITIGPESGWAFRELALVGMVLEVNTEGLRLGPAPGNPEGNIISWGNRRERLWKAKDAWRIIKSKSSNTSSN